MKTNTNYSSWELIKTAASDPERLGTPFLEKANELLQREVDEQRRGHPMNDVYRANSQLGIPSHELRNLKAMTTSQLEAYAEELYQQLRSGSIKRLTAA